MADKFRSPIKKILATTDLSEQEFSVPQVTWRRMDFSKLEQKGVVNIRRLLPVHIFCMLMCVAMLKLIKRLAAAAMIFFPRIWESYVTRVLSCFSDNPAKRYISKTAFSEVPGPASNLFIQEKQPGWSKLKLWIVGGAIPNQ